MADLSPIVISFEIIDTSDPFREIDISNLNYSAKDLFNRVTTGLLEDIDRTSGFNFTIGCLKYEKDCINYYMGSSKVRPETVHGITTLAKGIELIGIDIHKLMYGTQRYIESDENKYRIKRIKLFDFKC